MSNDDLWKTVEDERLLQSEEVFELKNSQSLLRKNRKLKSTMSMNEECC
jgi:hypothetical protein